MGAFTLCGISKYNKCMNFRRRHLFLPAAISAGSFLCLALIALLTDPVTSVVYIILFFGALFIFLLSFGYLLVHLRKGAVSMRNRYRIFIFSVFLIVLLMFRSSQSLSVIDVLILILITLGMAFYSSRRTLQ